MAIDASIYQLSKPTPVTTANPMNMAMQGMYMSQMGLNQAMLARQMQTQAAIRQAYANNVDQSGNVNQQGMVADVSRVNPMAAMQLGQQFNSMAKSQAETQSAKMDALQKTVGQVYPAMEYLSNLSEDDRATAYPQVMQQLQQQGVDMKDVPQAGGEYVYDPDHFNQSMGILSQTKAALDAQASQAGTEKTQAETGEIPIQEAQTEANTQKTQGEIAQQPLQAQLTQSETAKNNADMFKTGATEVGQFKDDILNASSRKVTGILQNNISRASRINSLVAPLPGETAAQTQARLNNYIPQVVDDLSASLGTMMQGGVPSEELLNRLDPGTIEAKLANIKQQWTNSPQAANQGPMLKSLAGIANVVGDNSRQQLQYLAHGIRQAYPYGNQQFPKQMDAVESTLYGEGSPAPISRGSAAGQMGGGAGPSAAASSGPSPVSSSMVVQPGTVRMQGPDGRTYRIPKSMYGEAIAAGGRLMEQ